MTINDYIMTVYNDYIHAIVCFNDYIHAIDDTLYSRQFLTIPPVSETAERVFSSAERVFSSVGLRPAQISA